MEKDKVVCINSDCEIRDTCDKFVDSSELKEGETWGCFEPEYIEDEQIICEQFSEK